MALRVGPWRSVEGVDGVGGWAVEKCRNVDSNWFLMAYALVRAIVTKNEDALF